MKKTSSSTASLRSPTGLIIGFLLPALLLFLVFFVYPLLQVISISLQQKTLTSETSQWIGLENYIRLMNDQVFWSSLLHNLAFVTVGGASIIILGLAIAVSLTKIKRGRDFFRIVFLFPNVMSIIAAAILWSFIFNPSFGLLNALLRGVGLGQFAHAWLGEPGKALWAVIFVHIWMSVGFYIVLFYAGLLRIPADYFEAARIDGANGWQEFRHITLPLLQDILQIATIYVIINSINVFALVFMVNEGRPARYNSVLLTYMYEKGIMDGNYGYACAIGVVTLIAVLLTAFAANFLFKKDTIEL